MLDLVGPEVVASLLGDAFDFQVVDRVRLTALTVEERTDLGVMREKIRADLKRYLTKKTLRRPLIMPVILEV